MHEGIRRPVNGGNHNPMEIQSMNLSRGVTSATAALFVVVFVFLQSRGTAQPASASGSYVSVTTRTAEG
jgi:hypothetical protein